jgi:short-subunit dehydrogenase
MATNYAATKAFIQSFAEGLHYELASLGVDVLSSAPGPVSSGFASRARMTMGKAASTQEVALGTVNGLGKTVTVRPGFLSKFLGWSLMTLPRSLRIRIMYKIMSGMTRRESH